MDITALNDHLILGLITSLRLSLTGPEPDVWVPGFGRGWYHNSSGGMHRTMMAMIWNLLLLGDSQDNMSSVGTTTDNYLEVNSLDTNVTYYWKVAVDDGYQNVASGANDFGIFEVMNNWTFLLSSSSSDTVVSADGNYMATSFSNSGWVHYFDTTYREPLWSYQPDEHPRAVDISNNGEYLAVGTGTYHYEGESDEAFYLRDFSASLLYPDLIIAYKDSCNPPGGSSRVFESVAISGDGEYIVTGVSTTYGNSCNKLLLFDKDSNTPLWSFKTSGYDYGFAAVDISKDGEYIIASSHDDNIYCLIRIVMNPFGVMILLLPQ